MLLPEVSELPLLDEELPELGSELELLEPGVELELEPVVSLELPLLPEEVPPGE